MQAGLVTTIIPVFNRPAMLREAVKSVLAQTYRPIEIVIVDDGSTDGTWAVAEALAGEHPDEIRVIHQANRGAGLARETGRLSARGEFIQHLDSDDVLYPRKFELQVEGLSADPDCIASYGPTRIRRADGTLDARPAKRTGERIDTILPSMLASRWWHTPTPLFRASAVHRAGAWLPLRVEEDWEFDVRVGTEGGRLHFVDDWVAEVRRHGDHLSSRGLDPEVLASRAEAHRLIYAHARGVGVSLDAPEMRRYARELFLLSRQCGAAGLAGESKMLFGLAREASGADGTNLQFRLYASLASAVGWTAAGRASRRLDELRELKKKLPRR